MPGFIVHQYPVSVLTFMTHIATKGHKDALRSELPPVAILVSKGHADLNRGHDDIQIRLLPRAMSGSVLLLWLGSVLMSLTHVTTGVHKIHGC